MKIFAKMLAGRKVCPFAEVFGLRGTVDADYTNKVFYVTGDESQNSWGIAFVMKEGYTVERPNINGLSVGVKDGNTYWVSVRNRPLTHDYFFEVKKDGIVTETYRVVYIT